MVPCETFVPRAKGTFVSPDGGVAKAFPPYAAPPTSTSRRAKSEVRRMPFPFRTRLRAGNGPRTPSVHLLGCVQPTFFQNDFLGRDRLQARCVRIVRRGRWRADQRCLVASSCSLVDR